MDLALWAVAAVLVVTGARAFARDMASRGVGGRGGWRYGAFFLVAPWFMVFVWIIERRRFPRLAS